MKEWFRTIAWWFRRPARSVVVCGTPRSGTTLLAGLLSTSPRVGVARELFDPRREPDGIADYRAFVDRKVERSRREVFAVKFVGDQLWTFLARLRQRGHLDGLPDRELLEQVFPDPRFVWLTRRDTVAQAVSLWRAGKTDEWWAERRKAAVAPPPAFDFDEIDSRIGEIARGERAWVKWFAASGIEPLRLVYEELDAAPAETARRVLAFIDVEIAEDEAIVPRTVRQSDGFNQEWIARYLRVAASRSTT